ncbi:GGDEF domain-containing protein [Gordonia phthalatica]|uniref:GGDEF domain-containing protein n=1 Tax=Gordonia phthalatica TaxID=1136941 RepID=UPI0007837311|nr:GGDEF domain-containing protein [Gordonia phthalatica]
MTTAVIIVAVVLSLSPVGSDQDNGSPTGGLMAAGFGVAGLIWLGVRPRALVPAAVMACGAIMAVMAFHTKTSAEYLCLIPAIFLAMVLRAALSRRAADVLVLGLAVGCTAAWVIAPAPALVFSYVVAALAIIAGARIFGYLSDALLTAAHTDPLTGVLNRAGWDVETAKLARVHPLTAIAVVDLDDLKVTNDTLGHPAGDRRITDLAESIGEAVPARSVLARMGGDEFAVCLTGSADELSDVATTLRGLSGATVGIAFSADIATRRAAAEELYAAADEDLTLRKAARRVGRR